MAISMQAGIRPDVRKVPNFENTASITKILRLIRILGSNEGIPYLVPGVLRVMYDHSIK